MMRLRRASVIAALVLLAWATTSSADAPQKILKSLVSRVGLEPTTP